MLRFLAIFVFSFPCRPTPAVDMNLGFVVHFYQLPGSDALYGTSSSGLPWWQTKSRGNVQILAQHLAFVSASITTIRHSLAKLADLTPRSRGFRAAPKQHSPADPLPAHHGWQGWQGPAYRLSHYVFHTGS